MLGIPITEVPNFWYQGDSPQACFAALRDWLNERGWTIITLPVHDVEAILNYVEGYVILGGRSSAGVEHCTIWYKGEMVHDPHPERKGLVDVTAIDILYPLEPWKWKRQIQR
jgi:hypothetical protein